MATETICGPYVVVTYWNADHGSAVFFDANGTVVAVLEMGINGTTCSYGPAQFTVPGCSTQPYCGPLQCQSQLTCVDAGPAERD